MILQISIIALSTCLYLVILFIALFAKTNTKTVKLARAASLPVMVFPLVVLLLISCWMITKDFIHRGLLAFKKLDYAKEIKEQQNNKN